MQNDEVMTNEEPDTKEIIERLRYLMDIMEYESCIPGREYHFTFDYREGEVTHYLQGGIYYAPNISKMRIEMDDDILSTEDMVFINLNLLPEDIVLYFEDIIKMINL